MARQMFSRWGVRSELRSNVLQRISRKKHALLEKFMETNQGNRVGRPGESPLPPGLGGLPGSLRRASFTAGSEGCHPRGASLQRLTDFTLGKIILAISPKPLSLSSPASNSASLDQHEKPAAPPPLMFFLLGLIALGFAITRQAFTFTEWGTDLPHRL